MNFDQPLTRRESLQKLLKLSGGLALASAAAWRLPTPTAARAAAAPHKFIIEGIGQKDGYSIRELTRKVFDAAGGINQFVARGDVVVIKPNLSYARRPELAATTHPEVLQAVVELCQEAGAQKVRIADNTIHDARRCFAISGAGRVAQKTGADLIYPRATLMRTMNLHGHRLDVWPVFVPLVEADRVINLPVAKHHSLSVLTLGMKGWIGAVDGSRRLLHQDINQTIVDLARFFNPTITLIDAIRIMTANGPSGGSLADVAVKNTLILSNDPVAADAKAALLFNREPARLGFIKLAQKWGLGTYAFNQLNAQTVVL
ncbi:MAG: DUF362 domain-containing protein [Desulfobacterales bacterium]|nr:MAG: DUF362 domain-containing protein [Desulfobacterales bacterium]